MGYRICVKQEYAQSLVQSADDGRRFCQSRIIMKMKEAGSRIAAKNPQPGLDSECLHRICNFLS